MIYLMPRFQGRVGQIEDPPELKGKWTFEIFVSFIGDGKAPERIEFNAPIFETRDAALLELRQAVKRCVESAQETADGKVTGQYIDLLTNQTKNFNDEAK